MRIWAKGGGGGFAFSRKIVGCSSPPPTRKLVGVDPPIPPKVVGRHTLRWEVVSPHQRENLELVELNVNISWV